MILIRCDSRELRLWKGKRLKDGKLFVSLLSISAVLNITRIASVQIAFQNHVQTRLITMH